MKLLSDVNAIEKINKTIETQLMRNIAFSGNNLGMMQSLLKSEHLESFLVK